MSASVDLTGQEEGNTRPRGISDAQWERIQALTSQRQALHEKYLTSCAKREKRKAGSDAIVGSTPGGSSKLAKASITAEKTAGATSHAGPAKAVATNIDAPVKQELQAHLLEQQRFRGTSHGTLDALTGKGGSVLEKAVELAIERRDYDAAAHLNDQLARSQHRRELARAVQDHEFSQSLQASQAERNAHKKPKLKWGLEMKRRWEMKGNM
eukprot:jgi/Mesvir1/27789/Mv07470-RA.1